MNGGRAHYNLHCNIPDVWFVWGGPAGPGHISYVNGDAAAFPPSQGRQGSHRLVRCSKHVDESLDEVDDDDALGSVLDDWDMIWRTNLALSKLRDELDLLRDDVAASPDLVRRASAAVKEAAKAAKAGNFTTRLISKHRDALLGPLQRRAARSGDSNVVAASVALQEVVLMDWE